MLKKPQATSMIGKGVSKASSKLKKTFKLTSNLKKEELKDVHSNEID